MKSESCSEASFETTFIRNFGAVRTVFSMGNLEIEVRGTSTITRDPERATLSITISSQGLTQETVSEEVSSTFNRLQQSFTELAPKTSTGLATPEAAITTFSTSFLRSWSNVPFDIDGKTMQRVYHASSGFEVIFRDFKKLGNVASELFLMPHVTVNRIDWRLTDPTMKALGAESRKKSMLDAISKANDYASVLGREVVAVKVTDQGASSHGMAMQSYAVQQAQQARQMRSISTTASTTASTPGGIALTPEKVVLSGSIHVTFVAVD